MVYRRRRQVLRSNYRIRYSSGATQSRSAARVYGGSQGAIRFLRRAQRRGYRYPRVMRGLQARNAPPSVTEALRQQHPCVYKWFKSLVSPWSGPLDACLPYLPPVYTERLRVFARNSISSSAFNGSGNAGVGLYHHPGNDQNYLMRTSTGAYVNDNTAWSTIAATNIPHNGPYTLAQFGDGDNACAVVSSGIRFRYTGPADQMQGSIVILESPAHTDMDPSTVVEIMSETAAVSLPVSQEWQSGVWTGPQHNAEFAYQSNAAGAPFANTLLIVLFRGMATAESQNFAVEAYTNFEVLGRLARGAIYSEQDYVGAGKAQQIVQERAGGTTLGNVPSTGSNNPSSDPELDSFFGSGSRGKLLWSRFFRD